MDIHVELRYDGFNSVQQIGYTSNFDDLLMIPWSVCSGLSFHHIYPYPMTTPILRKERNRLSPAKPIFDPRDGLVDLPLRVSGRTVFA